jgi:quinol monooxygenase YgiN
MVMTILEARVIKENWSALEQAFKDGSSHPEAGLEHSYLVRAAKDPDLWRILTIWSSREALDVMRRSVDTPLGVLMFRSANSEPVLSVYDIVEQIALQ